MHQRILTIITGTMLLAGCAAPYTNAPIATNFEASKQHKLQSASHWQLIAEDTSAQLISSLPAEKQRVYVVQHDNQTTFQKAFNQQLISSLIAAGYPVMKHPNQGYTLTVDVIAEPVKFTTQHKREPKMGEATMLAGGLWVLRNIYNSVSPGAAMMGGAVTYDIYNFINSENASGPTPQTELIVTASVSDDNRYYANSTNVYYTTYNDWYNYTNDENWDKSKPKVQPLPTKHFQLKGN